MPFKREWDSSCPHVWDRWEANGTTWVIQDLDPEDDEEALHILMDHLIPDETLCKASDMMNDPESLRSMADFWRICLAKRMSLACYAEKDGTKKLVALNCCIVQCAGENEDSKIEGEAWLNVYGGLKYMEDRFNAFEYLGLDVLLYAMGLVVRREYRGESLGSKILAARKPLSLYHGIKGTSTVFTGIASQKSAEKAGFTSVLEVTMRDYADAGLKYPRNDNVIKLMVKKFV